MRFPISFCLLFICIWTVAATSLQHPQVDIVPRQNSASQTKTQYESSCAQSEELKLTIPELDPQQRQPRRRATLPPQQPPKPTKKRRRLVSRKLRRSESASAYPSASSRLQALSVATSSASDEDRSEEWTTRTLVLANWSKTLVLS